MPLIALILLVGYGVLVVRTLMGIAKGKFEALLLYAIIFFPVYSLFLSINYDAFEVPILAQVIQYSKELIILSALFIWVFGQKNVLSTHWHISRLDACFIAFLALTLVYFGLGLGDATIMGRAIYVKNILLICIFYFFGRNIKIPFSEWNRMFQVIFVITVLACALVMVEKAVGTHFHSIAGYAKYNLDIKGDPPTGSYGLAYTFEAEGGRPRYGSFFAHPLELSSGMLITTAICIFYLLFVPHKTNKYKYLSILGCAFICVVFAYSRASFVAFFMMIAFMAIMLRYYQIIITGIVGFVLIALYIIFFAADEVLFFVIDTITFENSSSVTHIVDWLEAVNSIIENPMGIGLGMSGNAGGVEKELVVGGENQFLVYGVQLGVIGMLLYIGMMAYGIRNAWRAFRMADSGKEGLVPFVAAAVKFGLILPLFTANAEVYIYVCLVSWWFIGYAETQYQIKRARYKQMSLPVNTVQA